MLTVLADSADAAAWMEAFATVVAAVGTVGALLLVVRSNRLAKQALNDERDVRQVEVGRLDAERRDAEAAQARLVSAGEANIAAARDATRRRPRSSRRRHARAPMTRPEPSTGQGPTHRTQSADATPPLTGFGADDGRDAQTVPFPPARPGRPARSRHLGGGPRTGGPVVRPFTSVVRAARSNVCRRARADGRPRGRRTTAPGARPRKAEARGG
jgi:hypothetical protein